MSGAPPGPLVAVVGPTGVGKSQLALRLAPTLDGEIVSADSRQVYRGMDVGTGKPTAEQRERVRHHLIDLVDPDQEYSLAVFLRQAREAVRDVASRGKVPIIVGGTGQYVWGLLEEWSVPEAPPDPSLRRDLEARAEAEGHAALHRLLAERDPPAAARVDSRNVRRVIRALEVSYAAPGSSAPGRGSLPPRALVVALTLPRDELYRRIDARIEGMLDSGWVNEVSALLERGYGPELPSMSSLGYRELAEHLRGGLPLAWAAARIKGRTHRFARQQYAWFRPSDGRIRWHQATPEGMDAVESEVRDGLRRPARESLAERLAGPPHRG